MIVHDMHRIIVEAMIVHDMHRIIVEAMIVPNMCMCAQNYCWSYDSA